MRQMTFLIGLISLGIVHGFMYQLSLSTDSVSIVLDHQWKRDTERGAVGYAYPCWIVYNKRVYRLQIVGEEAAKNDSLSAALMLFEYQVPPDIPAEAISDRLIEHGCNAPFLIQSAVRASFGTTQSSSCNDLDVSLKHIGTLPIDTHYFDIYHITITLKYDGKEQSWEVRCLVGSRKDRLIMVFFSKSKGDAWDAQMEREWSTVIRQLQLKSRSSIDK